MTNSRQPTFLVIGNAVIETITPTERPHRHRTHLGGMGAIMARELALAGADTALLTTAPTSTIEQIQRFIKHNGVKPHVVNGQPPQPKAGQVKFTTRKGEVIRYSGTFSRPGGLAQEIAQLAPKYDRILVDMTVQPRDLQLLNSMTAKLTLNASTKSKAAMLLHFTQPQIITMNRQEAATVKRLTKTNSDPDMARKLNTRQLLVTNGAHGKTLYNIENDQPTSTTSPAPKVPDDTDFIGAGDSLSAGLTFTAAYDLDPQETMDKFLTQLLVRNANAY